MAGAATERYHELEREMGISAYCQDGDEEGFAAVLKARYSDFVVHEVDMDGNVARLTSLSDAIEGGECTADGQGSSEGTRVGEGKSKEFSDGTDSSRKRDAEDAVGPDGVKKSKSDEAQSEEGKDSTEGHDGKGHASKLDEAQKELAVHVGQEVASETVRMLQHWELRRAAAVDQPTSTCDGGIEQETDAGGSCGIDKGSDEDVPKFVRLPTLKDKEKRRAIHMLVRSDVLCSFAVADTEDGRVRIWHRSFQKEMPKFGDFAEDRRGGGRGKNKNRRRDNGNNRGGGKQWPKDRPDYLKFVLYKENVDTTTAAKDLLRYARIHPRQTKGGVGYAGMKDKRGVTSQYCTLFRKEPRDIMVINEHNKGSGGGGNTTRGAVSVLRVGNFGYTDQEQRLGTLGGNRFDVVLRNVSVRLKSDTVTKEQREKAIKRHLEKAALNLRQKGFINYFGMQRFGKYYDTHEVGLALLKGDFEKACDIIMRPKGDNDTDRASDARKRWSDRFKDVDDQSNKQLMEEAERKAAKSIARDMGRFMSCEISITSSLSQKPRDYKRAFRSIPKNLRSMFVHAVQSYLWNHVASERIRSGGCEDVMTGDLVLVGDKTLVEGGSGTSGLRGKSIHVVTEDEVAIGTYAITDIVLPLAGTKIKYPANASGSIFDNLLAKQGLDRSSFAKMEDRELALGGDYRFLLCKPSDVEFEVKWYEDPLEPLLQTDLMKITGVEIGAKSVGSCPAKPESGDAARPETTDEHPSETEQHSLCMIISFTLPPSAYATIALRELMKRPTVGEYQRKLVLEGNCERILIEAKGKDDLLSSLGP